VTAAVSQQQRVAAPPGPLTTALAAARCARQNAATSAMTGPVQPSMSRCSDVTTPEALHGGDGAQSALGEWRGVQCIISVCASACVGVWVWACV
jgi:hypothetical protein